LTLPSEERVEVRVGVGVVDSSSSSSSYSELKPFVTFLEEETEGEEEEGESESGTQLRRVCMKAARFNISASSCVSRSLKI
jgi:hypothetical protein